jgi:hypothetical protein
MASQPDSLLGFASQQHLGDHLLSSQPFVPSQIPGLDSTSILGSPTDVIGEASALPAASALAEPSALALFAGASTGAADALPVTSAAAASAAPAAALTAAALNQINAALVGPFQTSCLPRPA